MGACLKVDPNMQRPPEKDSCVKRRLLDGAKLPLRGMKSASWQVGAALAKPLTAAAQQLLGGRVTGKGAVSQPHGALLKAQPPGDTVSAACSISNSASPAKPCWVASLARDPGRPMGSGYPTELGAKPQEAAPWGGGSETTCSPPVSSSSLAAAEPRPDLGAALATLCSRETRASRYLVTTPPVA